MPAGVALNKVAIDYKSTELRIVGAHLCGEKCVPACLFNRGEQHRAQPTAAARRNDHLDIAFVRADFHVNLVNSHGRIVSPPDRNLTVSGRGARTGIQPQTEAQWRRTMGNESMQPADVLTLRMASLLLRNDARAESRTPAEIVTWFGAMQAQDLGSGEWSFGVRIPGCTRAKIDTATQNREIVRTWPMRGTVHFVPPIDAKWMLELTGVRALAGAAKRREYLGLTEDIVNRAVEVIEGALRGGKRMGRSQLVALLVAAGLHTRTEHGYHLLWYASQLGVTCIGPQEGNEQTFVLLDEWVPEPRRLSHDEALAELALRYFRSHGPTTRQDFAGWTGLSATDAKLGIELAGDALFSVDVEGTPHVLTASLRDTAAHAHSTASEVLLLPGFDEYLLGFKDRTLMVSKADMATVVPGSNGVFMATIVLAGRVVGTWRRDIKRNLKSPRVDIRLELFRALTKVERSMAEQAAHDYARFHELDAKVAWL
jgi:hypothetical protein